MALSKPEMQSAGAQRGHGGGAGHFTSHGETLGEEGLGQQRWWQQRRFARGLCLPVQRGSSNIKCQTLVQSVYSISFNIQKVNLITIFTHKTKTNQVEVTCAFLLELHDFKLDYLPLFTLLACVLYCKTVLTMQRCSGQLRASLVKTDYCWSMCHFQFTLKELIWMNLQILFLTPMCH